MRIPMIMFVSRLLCTLPAEMLTEEMVVGFVAALTNLEAKSVDSGTEQTARYALGSVLAAIGDRRLANVPNVRKSIMDARDWVLAIEGGR